MGGAGPRATVSMALDTSGRSEVRGDIQVNTNSYVFRISQTEDVVGYVAGRSPGDGSGSRGTLGSRAHRWPFKPRNLRSPEGVDAESEGLGTKA